MPALPAANHRGAFLAIGSAELTADGWLLFDHVAKGTAESGGWAGNPGKAGQWFLEDGAPTRSLSAQEYRDWVHEQVYNRVWKQLAWLFSLVGIGGIIAIGGIAAALITAQIRNQVKQDIGAASKEAAVPVLQIANVAFDKTSTI